MKLTLKEATKSAENGCIIDRDEVAKVLMNLDGCIIDRDEVAKVLMNLLSTPAKEFPKQYTANLKELLACGLEWIGNVSDEEFGEYTYLDLICLAKLTADTLILDDAAQAMPSVLLLSESIFLDFLQKTANYCTPACLFCAVNLKELLNILDELAGEPQNSFSEMKKLANRIKGSIYNYDLTPKSTVTDLIVQTERVITQCWRPWHNLRTFSYDVMVGYEVIHMIAFKCIKNAFSSSFRKWKKECDKRANQ